MMLKKFVATMLAAGMALSAFAAPKPMTKKPPMAGTHVKGYTRTMKNGKTMQVKGYTRGSKSPSTKTVAVKGYTRTTKSGKKVEVKGYTRKAPAGKRTMTKGGMMTKKK